MAVPIAAFFLLGVTILQNKKLSSLYSFNEKGNACQAYVLPFLYLFHYVSHSLLTSNQYTARVVSDNMHPDIHHLLAIRSGLIMQSPLAK